MTDLTKSLSPGRKAMRFVLLLISFTCLLISATTAMVVLATGSEAERLSEGVEIEVTVLKNVVRGGEVYVQIELPRDAPWQAAPYDDDKAGPWLSQTTQADRRLQPGKRLTVIAGANYARFVTPGDAIAAKPSPVWWGFVMLFGFLTVRLTTLAFRREAQSVDLIEAALARTRGFYNSVVVISALFGLLTVSSLALPGDPDSQTTLSVIGGLILVGSLILFLTRVRPNLSTHSALPVRLREQPTDMLWAYPIRSLRKDGIAAWRSVKVHLNGGAPWVLLCYRGEEDELLHAIVSRSPDVLIGYTQDNQARYESLRTKR